MKGKPLGPKCCMHLFQAQGKPEFTGATEENQLAAMDAYHANGLRPDVWWIDAGWYGKCTKCDEAFSGDWSIHTGEWEVNERVHPGFLRDVAKTAESGGANLMLWFEPERAVEGTKVTCEHPEWFLKLPGSSSQLLNYGEILHGR